MSIKIDTYDFEGPYRSTSDLKDNSGVYVILDKRLDGFYVIDVGESANVKTRIENHDRASEWTKNAKGVLHVAAHYTYNAQQSGRMLIEQGLRAKYQPVCGVR